MRRFTARGLGHHSVRVSCHHRPSYLVLTGELTG
jgi:hypothetical protein